MKSTKFVFYVNFFPHPSVYTNIRVNGKVDQWLLNDSVYSNVPWNRRKKVEVFFFFLVFYTLNVLWHWPKVFAWQYSQLIFQMFFALGLNAISILGWLLKRIIILMQWYVCPIFLFDFFNLVCLFSISCERSTLEVGCFTILSCIYFKA